ncbi:MAG: HAMP domain-containing protein [Candidatus Riflebacteria bacterium]|nr:HAMP domain-containing protein [Candidatus Riflebacteria bacterium]
MAFPTVSFRTRTAVAFVAGALIPILLLGVVVLHIVDNSLNEAVLEQHRAVLNAFRGGMNLFLSQRLARLLQIATTPEIQCLDPARTSILFPDLLTQSRFFTSMSLLTPEGTILSKTSRAGYLPRFIDPATASATSAQAFKVALRSGNGLIAPVFDEGEEDRSLLFLQPVPDFIEPHRIIGVLAAEAPLEGSEINEILSAFSAPADAYVCILDKTGRLIARQGDGLDRACTGFSIPSTLREIHDDRTTTVEIDNRERRDLLSLTLMSDLGCWLTVGRPVKTAFALASSLRENLILSGLLGTVFALGLGVLLARALLRPVMNLTQGLEKVREGVYSHRVDCMDEDELGEAAHGINALAERLQKHTVIGSFWESLRADTSSGKREPDIPEPAVRNV